MGPAAGNAARLRETRDVVAVGDAVEQLTSLLFLEMDDERVRERCAAWLAAQEQAGRVCTAGQRAWPDRIAEHVGVNQATAPEDLDDILGDKGG